MARTKSPYPRRSHVKQVVETARAIGIDVAGIEVSPSGIVKVIDARAIAAAPANDLFAEWDAKGLL